MSQPPVLIEDWLPIEALSVESIRERSSMTALPPTYYLHVWWARRPLITSRTAILASVLPPWNENWPKSLRTKFPNEESYKAWFFRLVGILGDPVTAGQLVRYANQKGIKLKSNPYDYERPFKLNPDQDDLETMLDLLETEWAKRDIEVMDPMAGGGSIPFEALRYGFTVLSNELNPVASVILKATLDYPARFGLTLTEDIRKWSDVWAKRVQQRLAEFFPRQPSENIHAYIWARTVNCPTTGKPVPLSPNWWLYKGSNPHSVRLLTDSSWETPQFEIVEGDAIDFDPDEGTCSRGGGRSPWTGETIDSDYIKHEAQVGRMGQMLYAIALKQNAGLGFRVPTKEDIQAIHRAEDVLADRLPHWEVAGLVPLEPFPVGNDPRPVLYGMPTWADFFSPRQLLSMITFLETLREVSKEMRQNLDESRAIATETYLGLMLDKAAIYNNRLCRFDPSRGIRSNFDRHDFAFVWSHGEFDASANLLPWTAEQVVKSYRELAELTRSTQLPLWRVNTKPPIDRLRITQGSATDLNQTPSGSIHHICVDPPYYDNVMYAELSDFFYVWLKRSVGHLFPEFFTDELTNKDDETVASPARFESMGRKKKDLAEQDYERKMAATFREMHRVLHPDGVLTVMFTHKRVEAWDTLASALIGAGFTIKASWPVHTESEHSLHIARKNAAASTILLVCRKRESREEEPVWWDDIQGQVRELARTRAREYAEQGISGVDLYISTFGPTLSLISENWPVLTSEIDPKTNQPRPLRPETALDLARVEVIRLRKQGLLAGRDVQFDPVTDWYLMAWDAFQAEQFPYDEARKLAIALGLEVDALMRAKRLVAKKGQYVVLQQPAQRRKKGVVDPDAVVFEHWIDTLHTAMLVYQEDGAGACDVFLMNRGLKRDSTFRAGLQAMINAIPRTRLKGEFVRPEADVLDKIRLAFYADELTVPVEEEPELPQAEQLGLEWDEEAEDEDEMVENTD
jgi:putative DNA methylase